MTREDQIKQLGRLIVEEGQKERPNVNVISSLTDQLSRLDDSQVRFSVDAAIINRLGKELVGRHETAVSELVKNAYDADSTEVVLKFKNAWQVGGSLVVDDNGTGMTRDQLVNGFMRLSSSDKIHFPKSPRYGRTRAGRKGIGRFATQRLGEKLTIITQTTESAHALKVTIDWNLFQMDKSLFEISSPIEFIPKSKDEGTTLIIENLRDGWSDAMIRRVYRYTSDLLQPFPLSPVRKEQLENQVDPGFHSSYFRSNGEEEVKIIDEEEAFLKHALAEIEGYVLEDGQGVWALKSEILDFPQTVFEIGKEQNDPESKYQLISGVHFKAYYFIYEASLLSSHLLSFIREVAHEKGGIRIYRNGFRVLPYGEKLNDWLGLDESTAKRVILGSHRNINFFGFVELTDQSGVLFDETSSREGLFENEAFFEVVDFVQRSLITAVQKISELRGKKATTSSKGWKAPEDDEEKDPSEDVDLAISDLENSISKSDTTDSPLEQSVKAAIERLKDVRKRERRKLEDEKRQMVEEINMLRILAGLGLVIGEFVHEVKRFLPGFNTDTKFLKNAVKEYSDALQRVERLESNIKAFSVYTSYFDRAIARNVLRELEPIELRDVVNEFKDVINTDLQRTGIKLHPPVFEGYDLFTVAMHPSEWASILFNFYTNAKKAIKRQRVAGEIFIKCGRAEGCVYLEFSDNGTGIPDNIANDIFNAFFTTSSAPGREASDSETLTGTGLGLKIVRDIAESYGGKTFVRAPEKNFKTTIRIEIPEKKN